MRGQSDKAQLVRQPRDSMERAQRLTKIVCDDGKKTPDYDRCAPDYDRCAPDFAAFGSETIHSDDSIPHLEEPCRWGRWLELMPNRRSEYWICALMTIDTFMGAFTIYSIFAATAEDAFSLCGSSLVWFMTARVALCVIDVVQIASFFLGGIDSNVDRWVVAFVVYQLLKTISCFAAGISLGASDMMAPGCIAALSKNSVTRSPLLATMAFVFAAIDGFTAVVLILAIVWSASIARLMRH